MARGFKSILRLILALHSFDSVMEVSGVSGDSILRPIILCNTAPENPDGDDTQQREKCLEEGAVDLAICRVADMNRDDIVEDLANGE